MTEPLALSYPTPRVRALIIGGLWGTAMSLEKVWQASFVPAAVALALFTGLGYGLVRMLLKTVATAKGFVIWGFREFEWVDVAKAAVLPKGLQLELRNARPAMLPRSVIEDPAFRDAIRVWLSTEHPVRRAMEQYYELRTW
jgi:hypothetical protein